MTSLMVTIPVGDQKLNVAVPNVIGVISPEKISGVAEERAEIARSLSNPIGTKPLRELAVSRKNAAIVINDITRPYPGGLMVEEIAKELNAAGIDDEKIILVVAYGNHRVNTRDELCAAYGSKVIDRFRVVHHRAVDSSTLKRVGYTKSGMDIQINREFAEADLKITTGCITPHQLAGFSGGRKSILPGIAGIQSLKAHHSFPVRPEKTSLGWLEGNRFHEEAMEAAYLAGVDFIVNSVDNAERELVSCVSGELTEAYKQGIELCKKIWTVAVPCKPDVVLVSPGGFPRDFDLHQSQKAIGCAEMICREGGEIILCAEARDGSGKPGKVLSEAESPEEIIERFKTNGYTPDSVSKAFMLARAITKFKIAVAGSVIPIEELHKQFLYGFKTIEEAVQDALSHYGKDAKFLVIPYASDIIPVLDGQWN